MAYSRVRPYSQGNYRLTDMEDYCQVAMPGVTTVPGRVRGHALEGLALSKGQRVYCQALRGDLGGMKAAGIGFTIPAPGNR